MDISRSSILNKELTVQVAFKKINTYTSIEMIMHFKIGSISCEYWVMRKGVAVIKTEIIDDAIDKFNSYKDQK